MDTPSIERLVGAIIFVVLIVLLVPEILSGPRRAAPAGGAAAGGPTRTYTIDLGNPVKPAATQVVDAKPTSLPPPPPPAVVPGQQPPAVSPPVTQATPSTAAEVKPPAATPSTPAAAKRTVVAPAAVGKESWGAQLGSFSKAENAERLAASLRGRGYRAFVSPIGTGSHVLHRVRVGPEATRAAAEALVARLKRDGQTASVVTLP
jgi:cell division septation protein DedD